ncbi:MAG: NAD(P)/FAD-dependent oxidoreductase [Sandaracinaceae bacterium]
MSRRVAIIGGGPAGSALVLNLLKRGVDPDDLVVLDRARFPRPKLCGGGITWRGTRALEALIGEPPGGARTVGIEFRCKVGSVDVDEVGGQWLFDRAELDNRLMDAVKAAGVEVREEVSVTGLEPGVDCWKVHTASGVERFEWVAGADGATSLCRRATGLRGGIVGRLVEAVYEPTGAPPTGDRLYFDFDPVLDGIPGYAWIFPYPKPGGDNLWKLGIMDGRGRTSGKVLRQWTDRFAARHGFKRVEDKIAGWPELYYDWRTRGHCPGLVLVGEAFGVDALLGEGIAPALFHAEYTAGRLADALHRGTRRIRGFERGFARTDEGWNLLFQARLADRIYGPAGYRWLKVLMDLPRLTALAQRGEDAYGRLAKHAPSLCASYAYYVLTHGLPPATPPALPVLGP